MDPSSALRNLQRALDVEKHRSLQLEIELNNSINKNQEYQDTIEKLREREAALLHRLILAETSNAEAAMKLGLSIQEDTIREADVLEELQDQVNELETMEILRAEAIQAFTRELHSENEALQDDLVNELAVMEYDVRNTVKQIVSILVQDWRHNLEHLRENIAADLKNESLNLIENAKLEFIKVINERDNKTHALLRSVCELLEMNMDTRLFVKALNVAGTSDEWENSKLRFLSTCNIPKVVALERALEDAQHAEAKAKKLALRVAERKDQELQSEKVRSKELAEKLELALYDLEKARTDFESVSTVIEELNRRRAKD